MILFILFITIILPAFLFSIAVFLISRDRKYKQLESEVLNKLNISNWDIVSYYDEQVIVKSRQSFDKYDNEKFLKDNKTRFADVYRIIIRKKYVTKILKEFIDGNEFQINSQYKRIEKQIYSMLEKAECYRINVKYITPAGNNLASKDITINQDDINKFINCPSLLMSKVEYNRLYKEQQREALNKKQHTFYEKVNSIIDFSQKYKDLLIIKSSKEHMDNLITQLFDGTVNSIKK